MAILLSDFQGRTINYLGSNLNVDLTQAAAYPIFTVGTVINRSPQSRTFVAFVSIESNVVGKTSWSGGNFQIDGGVWMSTQNFTAFNDLPTIVYPIDTAATRPSTYGNGAVFNFNVVTGNAGNGTAKVTAWGWAE